MPESAEVGLVRCPKCGDILPEVTGYSVYQCGACGAVLKAKNKVVDFGKLFEKSGEERTIETRSVDVSVKRVIMGSNDGSESDVRSTISSSSRSERRRISRDGAENHRIRLMKREEKWDSEADAIQDKRSDELRAKIALDFEYLAVQDEKEELEFQRSRLATDARNADINKMNGFRRAQGMYNDGTIYSNEGSKNFLPKSSHEYLDGLSNFDYDGRDRGLQLNNLDELKDQFTRPDNMSYKGKEKVPFDGGVAHPEPYVSKHSTVHTPLGMNRGALQYPHTDSKIRRPSYQSQYDDPLPLMRRQEMGNGYFPPQYPPNHDRGYGDPLRAQMLRENLLKTPGLNHYQPSRAYLPEGYMNDDMLYTDTVDTYAPNVSRHHPSCSCFQCRNKREAPLSFQSSAHDKFSDVRNGKMFNNQASFGPREYNRRSSVMPQNPQVHSRWPSDLKPEVNVVRSLLQRVHLPSGGRHCHPIAGGAPFLMCHSCFELLQLPKKVLSQNSDRKKMRCGACSTAILFTVSNKNIVVLINDVEEVDAPVKVGNNRVMLPAHVDGRVNQVRTVFLSDDFDDSRFEFQPMDRNQGQIPTGNGRDNKFMDHKNSRSTPDSEDPTAAPRGSNSVELPAKSSKGTPPPAGSLLVESLGYSSEYEGENNFVAHDKMSPSKKSTRQMSVNDSSPVTEIDIPTNEYANTGTTFSSTEGSSKQGGRGAESFFAGFRDRIVKDSNKTIQTGEPEKASVTVNGHLISDRLIQKAERLAGQIHPGHYWYDFRAGFWGVMGGPCLGIIPPFIPEFQHHMPENCSGGNTRVYVNGRELSQKDLNLLGRRGMPTERDRSYILEISGRLLDEDTGEELTGLGKLAPTVEKEKHGFGMRDPNEAAQTIAV
ncbi:hypothetical protein F511_05574 [Dorcoceras hygrometricum]|uniref:Uncharacterized protein n=1 Tax=Dorcoceras hygrometricum TaxID=472368 RepID=A0A2Z7AJE0_9LAMI|nr:hypothetical protein F511_05574 [Dorcoceras hygrometricum]